MTTRREAKPASIPAVQRGNALDVANLPSYGFSQRSLMSSMDFSNFICELILLFH